ncbi:UrcA family protein [Qipengyuania sp. MTN3-11]|uniref:UrcA family protein n=1 Tax=Qipengyuania sp. MTN3-11 TaxID=3056557 RepID=UPI0036F2C623
MRKIQFPGALVALALGSLSVSAGARETPSEDVRYLDLDLRTDAGVKSLDNRIEKAVRKVCGGVSGGGYFEWMFYNDCKAATLASVTPVRNAVIERAREQQGLAGDIALSVVAKLPTK